MKYLLSPNRKKEWTNNSKASVYGSRRSSGEAWDSSNWMRNEYAADYKNAEPVRRAAELVLYFLPVRTGCANIDSAPQH